MICPRGVFPDVHTLYLRADRLLLDQCHSLRLRNLCQLRPRLFRVSMLACQEGSLGADRHVFTYLSTATAMTLILVDNRDDYDPA